MSFETKYNNDESAGFEDMTTYLEFDLGNESYGVKLIAVREVITVPETTPLPNGPKFFKGIMNLRGQIISIVDLRDKLGIKANNTVEEAVVIVDFDGISIGLIVDSINKVLNFNMKDLVEIPEVQSQVNAQYIQGVYKSESKLTLLLDIERIFNIKELQSMSQKAA